MPVRQPRRKYVERELQAGDRIVIAAGNRTGMTGKIAEFQQREQRTLREIEGGEGPVTNLFVVIILDAGGRTTALLEDLRLLGDGVKPRRVTLP